MKTTTDQRQAMRPLLTTAEAAAALGVKPQTLRLWRSKGIGPAYCRIGAPMCGVVRYRQEDLEGWLARRHFVNPGAETMAAGRGA